MFLTLLVFFCWTASGQRAEAAAPTLGTPISDVNVNEDPDANAAELSINLNSHFSGATSYVVASNSNSSLVTTGFSPNAHTLKLTIAADASGAADITVTASNGDGSTDDVFTVNVTAVNDPPSATDDTATTTENSPVTTNVITNDTDIDDSSADLRLVTTGTGAPAIVSATMGGDAIAIADASLSLQASGNEITFDPLQDFDLLKDGETATVVISYTVQDTLQADETGVVESAAGTLTVTVDGENDAPVIAAFGGDGGGDAVINQYLIKTNRSLRPFADLDIEDLDADSLTVSVTLTELNGMGVSGSFEHPDPVIDLQKSGSTWSFTLTNDDPGTLSAEVSDAFQQLEYHSQSEALASSQSLEICFEMKVDDGLTDDEIKCTDPDPTPPAPDLRKKATIEGSPLIIGTSSDQFVNDSEAITPFSSVEIQNPAGGNVEVLITMNDDALGLLAETNNFKITSVTPSNTLTFSGGNAEAATAAIRQLIFNPAENQLASVGEARFTITLNSAAAPPDNELDSNDETRVKIGPTNDAPDIVGTNDARTNDATAIRPFGSVAIIDIDEGGAQRVTLRIRMEDPEQGSLTSTPPASRGGAITSLAGTSNASPVTVVSPAHGLVTGDLVQIFGHGGDPGYNSTHAVTVPASSPNTFTIPVNFVGDDPVKGFWLKLTPANDYTGTDSNAPVNVVSAAAHGLTAGDEITVSGYGGPTPNDYNQVHTVAAVPELEQFEVDVDFQDISAEDPSPPLGGWFAGTISVEGSYDSLLDLGNGELLISGTPEEVTEVIRGLQFIPQQNRQPVGGNETVAITIGVNDGILTRTSRVEVIVDSINGAPIVTVPTEQPSGVIDEEPIRPFDASNANVTIDDEGDDELNVKVTLDDPNKGNFFSPALMVAADLDPADFAARSVAVEEYQEGSDGKLRILSTAHGLSAGDLVAIAGYEGDGAYNGGHVVTATDTDWFEVTVDFEEDSAPRGDLIEVFVGIEGYQSGNGGALRVLSTGHGLSPSDLVAISGYGGEGFYNGVHQITATDTDWFEVPANFKDDSATKGSWVELSASAEEFEFAGSPVLATAVLQTVIYELNGEYPFTPDNPGGTTFTIEATDSLNNTDIETLAITLIIEPTTWIVTTTADDGAGSLREAIVDLAGPNDHIIFGFAIPMGEALAITLGSEIAIGKHLTIHGPGADKLIITGDGSSRLFSVNSFTTIRGLTLQGGNAPTFGGAIAVEEFGNLHLLDCTLRRNRSAQWGGAVDVGGVFGGGSLTVERCLFLENTTDQTLGRGGGAISLYTNQTCTIVNTTFSANEQRASNGTGGGAIYAQAANSGLEFPLFVINSTFAENDDASDQGSSIHSRSFNTDVWVKNSIFADARGKNLEVAVTGKIRSLGGNISDDPTTTVFTQNGVPRLIVLLEEGLDLLDQSSDDIGLLPLANNTGPSPTYLLEDTSVARGHAVANEDGSPIVLAAIAAADAMDNSFSEDEIDALPLALEPGTDQRGIWRDWTATVDSGALQTGGFKQIIINEIAFDPAGGDSYEFVEFYNPRSSEPILPDDIVGFELVTGSQLRHLFTPLLLGSPDLNPPLSALDPGLGFVVAASDSVLVPSLNPSATPPIPSVPIQYASTGSLSLDNRRDTVVLKNALGQVLEWTSYVGNFATGGDPNPAYLDPMANQSIVQSPEFMGGFLPHKLAMVLKTGQAATTTDIQGFAPSSPGKDLIGVSLSGGNAPPIAIADRIELTEDSLLSLPLLANDIEFDRIDEIRVIALGNSQPTTDGSSQITTSPNGSGVGAIVTIRDGGFSVDYDPLDPVLSFSLQELIEGELLVDQFYYTVIDRDVDTLVDYPQDSDNRTLATTLVTLEVSGVNDVPVPQDRNYSALEDEPIRILVDDTLLGVPFDFEDDTAHPATLMTSAALLPQSDDYDIDKDDDNSTLLVSAISAVGATAGSEDLTTLNTISSCGATVVLDFRFKREESSIVYDPSTSETLNRLASGETVTDTFQYSLLDRHGAVQVATISVEITGVNDGPMANDDDLGLATNEDTTLEIDAQVLLANDTDPDTDFGHQGGAIALPDVPGTDLGDVLQIQGVVGLTSELGAMISWDGGTNRVIYTPSTSPILQALARDELLIEPVEDFFEYTMEDERGDTSTAVVRLRVIGVNDTPTAVDDSDYDTLEDVVLDVPVEIGLLANDIEIDINEFDPDDLLRVEPNSVFETAAGGIVLIQQDGSFTFDPRESSIFNALGEDYLQKEGASYTLVDSFDYTIIDNSLTQAINDVFSVETDTGNHSLPVLANDRAMPYPGAQLLIIADSLSDPDKGGSVIINGDGTELIFTPLTNFVGVDTFSYAISDGLGGTDTATVRVNVIVDALNGNLIANDDHFTMGMGTMAELKVLTNDHVLPESGESLFITGVSGAEAAKVTISADQKSLIYAPAPSDVGDKTFSYSVSAGGISEPSATVMVKLIDRARALNLDPHPDGNSIFDDSFSVAESSADNPLPVLANDFILPGAGGQLFVVGVGEIGDDPYDPSAPLPTSIATASNGSTVAINESGDGLIYTPGDDFRGDESFLYKFTDGAGGTGHAVVNTTVVGDFQPNVDRFKVLADGGQVELDVLLNDSILGGEQQVLVLDNVGGGADDPDAGGTASDSGSDTVVYEPAPGFVGEETFRYRVKDDTMALATGTVIIDVVASGGGLNPMKDAFSVALGAEEMALAVMANDAVFPGGIGAAFVSKVGPTDDDPRAFTTSNGSTVSVNETSDGLLYTPAEGFSGDESFIYTIEDGTGLAASANVTVFIPGSRLIADDNRYAVATSSVDNALDVLLNDTIIPDEGQTRVITGVGLDTDAPDAEGLDPNAPGISGSVKISGSADKLSYTPDSSTASEKFKYEISDGTLARAEGEVMILIPDRAGVLEPNDDVFSVEQGSENNSLVVLANDLIVPGTGESWTIIPLASSPGMSSGGGEFRVNSTRTAILYTPDLDFIGTDTFAYEVSDGLGGTGIASVSVKVGDLPTNADTFVVLADSVDNPLVVLANDEILPATAGEFVLLRAFHLDSGGVRIDDLSSLGGTLVVDGDVILYTPPADTPPADTPPNSDKTTAIAVDSFIYEVVDDTGDTVEGHATVSIFEDGSDRDVATVSVTLIGVNDAPTIDTSGATQMVITDKSDGMPFDGVVLIEVDEQGNQIIKVIVTIDDPDSGTLTNLGGFVESTDQPGVYEFVGTAAAATIALQGLTFIPMENWVMVTSPPIAENFGFTLSIMDNDPDVASPLTTIDTSVSIDVTAVNDPPLLAGAIAGQSVYYKGSIKAFAGVVVTELDDHELQVLTVDVELDDPTHGILVSPSGGFADQGGGVYRFIGTAADATAALGELEFEPTTADRLQAGLNPADSEMTQFTITVDDQFGGIATDVSTTVTAIHGFIAEMASINGTSNDNMGWSVGASGDFVVAGAPNEDDNGNSSGAAYVFAPTSAEKDAWQESAKLLPDDGAGGDQFGTSVDVDGEFIVVGAPNEKTGGVSSGAAYVFGLQAGNWIQVAKLRPSDGANSDNFGFSVAISGDLLVVGSPQDDDGETASGSVYVYENQAGIWTEISKLTALLPDGGAQLGLSVDIDGDTIIAGAPFSTPGGVQTGSAYIFERDNATTWNEVAQLVGSDASVNGQLGQSVGIDGNTAVAGAPLHDENGTKIGAAYLFERDAGWDPIEIAKLLPPDGENTDEFGFSVDISGDDVVVGMHNDSNLNLNQSKFGTSYIYNRDETGADQWGLLETIVSLSPDNNDELGFSVAIGEHTVAIGIPFNNPAGGGDAGGVIIYRLKYNNAPVSRLPIGEQFAEVGVPYLFAIPTSAFGDPDVWESLTYSATTPGGLLPDWIILDPATGTFSGEPLGVDLGSSFTVDVVVTDEDGLTAQTSFTLTVRPALPVTSGHLPDEVVRLSQPEISIAGNEGSDFVELRFFGLRSAASGAEMHYSIEISTDLSRWEPATGELVEGAEVTGDSNVRELIWRSEEPLTSLSARYFRIHIKESVSAGD